MNLKAQPSPAPVNGGKRGTRTSGVERTLQILDWLQARQHPASAYEVAKGVAAPLSTIYSIVDDLVGKNILQRQDNGAIWLGARLYHYGLTYARNLDLLTVACEEMQSLSALCGETVQICGRDDDKMVVLAMADGPDHFQVSSRVGTRIPLNWSASGRLLAGHLPEQERLALYARSAKASPTGSAETDPAVLSAAAAQALNNRLSIQVGESDFAVACIAAPICDPDGVCRATISIVVPAIKAEQDEADLSMKVQRSAAQAEMRMGWRMPPHSPSQ